MKPVNIDSEKIKKEAYLALLKEGHLLSMPAKGWSMHPALKDGDRITIKYLDPREMKIGDIIACKKPGEVNTLVHRLVKKWTRNGRVYLVTKGDAALTFSYDPAISKEDILGKVVARERQGRMMRLDSLFIRILGYIYARATLYCPWALLFLRRIVRALRKPFLVIFR